MTTPIPLRGGVITYDRRLDRIESEVTTHLEKFPLTAATMPASAQPVVIGVPWYSAFDNPRPIKVGRRTRYSIIGDSPDLGHVRGGHATVLKPEDTRDSLGWWRYYNQGTEGRCVEFACLRALTLLNRKRYDITSRWHYHEMQRTDEWQGGSYPGASPSYEGTSVRAGLEVLRAHGAITALPRGRAIPAEAAPDLVDPDEGIAVYRWALDWADVRRVTKTPDFLPGVPMLNSWGTGYPHVTLLADAAGERLMREGGEFGVVTDR